MNIVRSNYAQTLPFVMECIKKSHFIAIDFEMTGVNAHPKLRNSNLDSIQLRYWKAKENAKRFLPIQMGLCGFEITKDKNIIAYPFNFYIFPTPLDGNLDKKFYSQASALNFLAGHSFDFNKLIYDGIYYLNRHDMAMLEENKEVQQTKKLLNEMSKVITPEMQAFNKTYLPRVQEFMNNPEQKTLEIDVKFIKVKVYKYLEIQVLRQYYNIPLYIKYDDESIMKRSKMIIQKVTKEELEELRAANPVNKKEHLEDTDPVGFRKVIDYIAELQIPLLCHNGFLDILHVIERKYHFLIDEKMYNAFFGPLPETQKEFKIHLKKDFPVLYDTKYLQNNSNIIASDIGFQMDLSSFYKAMLKYHTQEPKIEIAEGFDDYKLAALDDESVASHEAGYDALVTGYVFFKSLGVLNMYNSLFDKTFVKRMKFYENRIPLGGVKTPFNLNYEDDIYKDATLVFYMENKHAVLQHEEIKKYFEENFGSVNLYQIYGDRLEYFLIFQKHESGVRLNKWLSEKNGQSDVYLDSSNGKSMMKLQSFEKYEEDLRKDVTQSMDQFEMPKILDIIGR